MSSSATANTVAIQAPLPTRFPKQEYWSGLPFPSPGDLCSPGIEPRSPALQADSLLTEPPGKQKKWNHYAVHLKLTYIVSQLPFS